jgi:transposase InsO family protein
LAATARLSTSWPDAGATGHQAQSQETLSTLQGRTADRAQARCRKRALGTRAPMAIPQGRNLRWLLDFVTDSLVNGWRFRIPTLVDDFTRECLGLVVDTSLTGLRVARELDRIAELRH